MPLPLHLLPPPATWRCARQTRGERSHSLQPQPPLPIVSPLTPLLQRHKGFIYASAHVRDVDGPTVIEDGRRPVGIDARSEISPGDAIDVEVANAHAWGSNNVMISDGAFAASALNRRGPLPAAHHTPFAGDASPRSSGGARLHCVPWCRKVRVAVRAQVSTRGGGMVQRVCSAK